MSFLPELKVKLEELHPGATIVYLARVGSKEKGVATETSDTDLHGIYVSTKRNYFVDNRKPPTLTINLDNDVNVVLMEVRKWALDIIDHKPTALEMFLSETIYLDVIDKVTLLENLRTKMSTGKLSAMYLRLAIGAYRNKHSKSDRKIRMMVTHYYIQHLLVKENGFSVTLNPFEAHKLLIGQDGDLEEMIEDSFESVRQFVSHQRYQSKAEVLGTVVPGFEQFIIDLVISIVLKEWK